MTATEFTRTGYFYTFRSIVLWVVRYACINYFASLGFFMRQGRRTQR